MSTFFSNWKLLKKMHPHLFSPYGCYLFLYRPSRWCFPCATLFHLIKISGFERLCSAQSEDTWWPLHEALCTSWTFLKEPSERQRADGEEGKGNLFTFCKPRFRTCRDNRHWLCKAALSQQQGKFERWMEPQRGVSIVWEQKKSVNGRLLNLLLWRDGELVTVPDSRWAYKKRPSSH